MANTEIVASRQAKATGTPSGSTFLRGDNTWAVPPGSGASTPFNQTFNCRLTLTSGVPVTTGDVTGAASVYAAPYLGNSVALWDAVEWTILTLSEITIALGTLVNGQAYDVFLYDNSGSVAAELLEWQNATVTMTIATPGVVTWTGHGLSTGMTVIFTNAGGALPTGVTANTVYYVTKVDANSFKLSTTLATLTAGTFVATSGSQSGTHTGHTPYARQTAVTYQDGVLCKSGDKTRRLAGTFVTTATTTTEDSKTNRLLASVPPNQVLKPITIDNSNSHSYSTASWRSWNNDASSQGSWVQCLAGVVQFNSQHFVGSVSAGTGPLSSVGVDQTSTQTAFPVGGGLTSNVRVAQSYGYQATAGYHYAVGVEYGNGSTTTWSEFHQAHTVNV